MLISLERVKFCTTLCFRFKVFNNQAEYEALLVGLRLDREISTWHLQVLSDSQLVVNHVNVEYYAKERKMASYLSKVLEL